MVPPPLLQRRRHHWLLAVAILLVSSSQKDGSMSFFLGNKGFGINPVVVVVTAFSLHDSPPPVVSSLLRRRTTTTCRLRLWQSLPTTPNRHPPPVHMVREKKNGHDESLNHCSHDYEGPPFRLVRCFPQWSRRQAEQAVSEGRVRVGGDPVLSKSKCLVSGEVLTLDGRTISWEPRAIMLLASAAAAADPTTPRHDASHLNHPSSSSGGNNNNSREEDRITNQFRYWKYNKPVGVTCTMDEFDRRGLWYALPPHLTRENGSRSSRSRRLFPAGRLDLDSRGLVLLTDDGRLADALLQPRFQHTKEYIVVIQPPLSESILGILEEGVVISTVQQKTGKETTAMTLPCTVEPLQTKPDGTQQRLRMVLTEGRNRQIRKMMQAVGSQVTSLTRVRHGSLQLGTHLPVGHAVEIVGDELESLLSSAAHTHPNNHSSSGGNRDRIRRTGRRRTNRTPRRSGGGKRQD